MPATMIYVWVQGAENNAYWNPIMETLAMSERETVRLFDEWVARRTNNLAYFRKGADGEPLETMSEADRRWRATHRYELKDAPRHLEAKLNPPMAFKALAVGEAFRFDHDALESPRGPWVKVSARRYRREDDPACPEREWIRIGSINAKVLKGV